MRKQSLRFIIILAALQALAAPAAATVLPSYSNAIVTSAGVPLQATITVYAAGTTTASTIYSDAAGLVPKSNPFSTDSLGRFTFYAATGLYDIKVSGTTIVTYTLEDVALGLHGEDSVISKTETRTANNYPPPYNTYGQYTQIAQTFTVAPAATAVNAGYNGHSFLLTVPATNTQPISSLMGASYGVQNYGTGPVTTIDGFYSSASNNGPTATGMKGGWFNGNNFGAVSGFVYGVQADISNWSYPGYYVHPGTIAAARVVRARLQNNTVTMTYPGYETPPGVAAITTAQLFYGNLDNSIAGDGASIIAPTIGAFSGLWLEMLNGAHATITTSKYINLETPSNAGTLTNHYGIYLADQTVAGTTLNYAVYSAGGTFSIRGPSILGCPTSVPTLENSQITFSVNESTHVLTITVKYSNGTVKTASLALI